MACGCQHIGYPRREDVKLDFKADFRAIKAAYRRSGLGCSSQMSDYPTTQELAEERSITSVNERIGYNQPSHTSGCAEMERIYDTLQRIQSLWRELERTKPDSSEYVALMNQIRALSDEYRALIDVPKKPRESK